LLIDVYNRLNQPGDAQKIFETYLKTAEPNVGNLLAMARTYCDYRQYDQAERTVKEAAKLEPDNAEVKTMATAIAIARGQQDRIPRDLKDIDAASMRMFFDRAQRLWTEGEQDQALALMGDVHDRLPQSLEATAQLVAWLRQRKETDKADEVAKQTRQALAAKPDALRELAVIMETDPAKQLETVLKDIDERIKDPSGRALARFDVLMESKQEEKALAELKPVQEKDPNNPNLIEKLFNYYLGKAEWDQARKYADLAAKLNTDEVGGKLYQALLDLNQNHLDQAIATLNEVVGIRPKFHMAHALLGECYLRQQNMEIGRAHV
jgi:tetratricopeptide (TPR) repeat protein